MLLELEITDNSVKIVTDETFLYLPLTREPAPDELKSFPEEAEEKLPSAISSSRPKKTYS